jgi:hypothetical protein
MLDDPWIPSFFENIVHLDEEPLFERILQNAGLCLDDLFTDVFHSSLENVCVYEEHLVGLPVLGNVQMLIHQCSVQERLSPPEDSQLDMDSAFLDLSTLEDFCGATQTRLGIRDDIGSERVAIFWELLRALGHQDKCVGGEITIDLEKAKQARSWLNQFTSRISLRDLRRSLLESHSTMAAAIGWPDWVSSDIANYLSPLSTIRFQQFTEYPTMGSWLLALPREPLNPNFRRYAIEMITALTTNHSIQFFLAKRGNIPVLRTLEHVVELKEIPFWANNYAPIHDALAHALPRPRTPYWIAIEDGLHTMLSNNSRFEDLPGLHFLPSQRSEV